MFVPRLIKPVMRDLAESPVGKGLILTGARQTGKTTFLRREFLPSYEYHSFDEALYREQIARRPAADWIARGKNYIFDEVQKAPAFLGTVKALLDRGTENQRVILSGSAQIVLLSGVRETLAGRVVTRELYPLTVTESSGVEHPLLCDLFACNSTVEVKTLLDEAALGSGGGEAAGTRAASASAALEQVLAWGGMPALLHLNEEAHRWIWLEEYCQTYLQRDVADLGRVSDLDDFLRLQRIAARRTATVLNYADLARDADLSPLTAKKYLRYLELSYQAFILPAQRKPRGKRLIKAPRLHWMDTGVQRVLSGWRQGLTGAQFESGVIAEIHKLVRTLRLPVELSFLRTKDGREVDLLVELPGGKFLAFEFKASPRAAPQDARHLRGLGELLGAPVLAGMVIHQGDSFEKWDGNLYGVPALLLFTRSPG